jgi:hypothetical protein
MWDPRLLGARMGYAYEEINEERLTCVGRSAINISLRSEDVPTTLLLNQEGLQQLGCSFSHYFATKDYLNEPPGTP